MILLLSVSFATFLNISEMLIGIKLYYLYYYTIASNEISFIG